MSRITEPGAKNRVAARRASRESAAQSEQPRHALYRLQAEICRVLGHPQRLAILDLLKDGERSNAELLQALGISKVNLSRHLAVMRHAGLVSSRQQGRETFHRLNIPEITEACRITREVLSLRLQQSSQLSQVLASATNVAAQEDSCEKP